MLFRTKECTPERVCIQHYGGILFFGSDDLNLRTAGERIAFNDGAVWDIYALQFSAAGECSAADVFTSVRHDDFLNCGIVQEGFPFDSHSSGGNDQPIFTGHITDTV